MPDLLESKNLRRAQILANQIARNYCDDYLT
jgi:hypothetical protein